VSVIVAANVLRACEGGDFNHKISYEEPQFNYTINCHTKHVTATFASPLLPDALLSVRSGEVSSLRALCPKRFTLEALVCPVMH